MQIKLGNIVDESAKTVYDVIFNKVSSFDERDKSLPTLIIGMDLAKSVITNFSVLNRGNGNLRWTFSKTERRSENTNDLINFKKYCIERFGERFRYKYVNFTCYPLSRIKKFVAYLYGDDEKVCFLTRDSRFVFIFSEKFKTVWGLSLSLCDYIGVNRKKVIGKMKQNIHNMFINGVSFSDDGIRSIIADDTHLIPVLLHYFGKK